MMESGSVLLPVVISFLLISMLVSRYPTSSLLPLKGMDTQRGRAMELHEIHVRQHEKETKAREEAMQRNMEDIRAHEERMAEHEAKMATDTERLSRERETKEAQVKALQEQYDMLLAEIEARNHSEQEGNSAEALQEEVAQAEAAHKKEINEMNSQLDEQREAMELELKEHLKVQSRLKEELATKKKVQQRQATELEKRAQELLAFKAEHSSLSQIPTSPPSVPEGIQEYVTQQAAILSENEKNMAVIEELRQNLTDLSSSLLSSQARLEAELEPVQKKLTYLGEVHESLKESLSMLRARMDEDGARECADSGESGHSSSEVSVVEEDAAALVSLMDKLDKLETMIEAMDTTVSESSEVGSCIDQDELETIVTSACVDEASNILAERLGSSAQLTETPSSREQGRPDFAQRGAGASIITSLTSPTYNPDKVPFRRLLQLVGYYTGYGFPEDAISVGTALGHCWPMEGRNGSIAIKLARPVEIDAISIDHVPQSEALSMSSAPKSFDLYTYSVDDARTGEVGSHALAGEYFISGSSVQSYTLVQPRRAEVVRLQINDNHGNDNYTCLYRVRVHGKWVEEK